MGASTPALGLLALTHSAAPRMLYKIGEQHKDDPAMAYQKQTGFVDAVEIFERQTPVANWGKFSKGLRATVESSRKSKPGDSLLTDNKQSKRKRIYGMGGSQGEEKSGTVKKPTLGGE